jgi:virginiamycin B lyase
MDVGPGVTVGPDGAIWFTGYNSNHVGRMSLGGELTTVAVPTDKSMPYHIVNGPDGALWFTEMLGNKIGRLEVQP